MSDDPTEISTESSQSRIPEAVGGIQVNFCKKPSCENFGIPASMKTQPRGRYAHLATERDTYKLTGSKRKTALMCHVCHEETIVKSNKAIKDEYDRLTAYLSETSVAASCPNEECPNHTISIDAAKRNYQAFGKTHSGSTRYRCKSCGKTFSVGNKPTLRQKMPHKNAEVFRLIMNKTAFKRAAEIADVGIRTIFDKIDFIHSQCLAFAGNRERKLLNGELPFRRLYISVDCQAYTINWSKSSDRRNVIMSAIGSADNGTGYIFGMHLNFDPTLDPKVIGQEAINIRDYDKPMAYRNFARLWLPLDYTDSIVHGSARKVADKDNGGPLYDGIQSVYDDVTSREDVESFEAQSPDTKLPARGMQVRADYTAYGHFLMLKKLCSNVEKVRFFVDQDSTFRGACLSAFADEIRGGSCDVFYVRIKSEMSNNDRKKAIADTNKELNRLADQFQLQASLVDLKHELIKEKMRELVTIGKWRDRWLIHPIATKNEPEKAVCYLTDRKDYDEDHLARLYAKASLQGIDRFFGQARHRISVLSRQRPGRANKERQWFLSSAYNPERVMKLLDIFRVFYNYIEVGEDKQTPAMRLGLAKSKIRVEDIIYYK